MTDLSQQEATSATSMLLQVNQIQPYERNPRHGKNPEYDRIKASIRANGLDQPLVITQRPGTTDYVVHSGGNTRLVALQELYAETGDTLFAHAQCMFKTWSCESDVLLAHLRENDLRGALTFIDKAIAIFDIKQLLEDELEIEEISLRKLQMVLATGGYSLSPGLISRMGYAVDRLLPVIPKALDAGLGRPQIQRIRALDKAALQIWQKHALGDDKLFEDVFSTLCQRYDTSEWDTGLLHEAIETEIAEQAEISIQTVRMELDALLAGREPCMSIIEDNDSETDEIGKAGNVEETFPAKQAESPTCTSSKDENSAEAHTQHGDPIKPPVHDSTNTTENETSPVLDEQVPNPLSEEIEPTAEQTLATTPSPPTDLKSLRSRAWTLAARLAQRNGIGDLVEPLSGKGLGFILRDVPDPTLAEQLDDDTLSQISMVWWHLAASAEMTAAPVESITPHLPLDSVLRKALEQQDAGLLFSSVWTLDPGQAGCRLWRRLGEKDWSDFLDLMDTYRQIHHLAEETDVRLWG